MQIGFNALARVRRALNNNGYFVEGIDTATFHGYTKTTDRKEIYAITFINEDNGEPDSGFVYVWVERGKLIADF